MRRRRSKVGSKKVAGLFQHGDVLIERFADGIPKGAKRLSHTRLAEGETTGHAHVAVAEMVGELPGVELYEVDGTLYMNVAADEATVTHEEHKPITIPKGTYKIRRVREFDHFDERTRRVTD